MNTHLSSFGAAFANHLWQSTAFALVVWALAWMLRKNHARVRYALWLGASAKFLIPLSLLVWVVNLGAGNLLTHAPRPVTPVVYSAVNFVEAPFTENLPPPSALAVHSPTMWERYGAILPFSLGFLWALGAGIVLIVWWNRWRAASAILRKTTPAVEGRELGILRRVELRFQKQMPRNFLPLRLSAERMEPAVFGLFRPALVWPRQLSERLDDEQIEAILAHELMHVKRRDNLTAALHMLVEAVFWFHPLVWWMDRQLIKEREQACDEAVVAMGGDVETYAESLLQTCRFCIESRLPCVAGVTGAELKERVAGILSARVLLRMTWPKKLLLGATAVCAVAVPVFLGQAKAAEQQASSNTAAPAYVPTMTFDVASIRQTKPYGPHTVGGTFEPANSSHLTLENVFLYNLLEMAYPGDRYKYKMDGQSLRRLPLELQSATFDVRAKADDAIDEQLAKLPKEQVRFEQEHMVQVMLAERFHLKVHWETRDSSTYDLVVTKPNRLMTTGVPSSPEEVKEFGDYGVPPIYQKGDSDHGFQHIAHSATSADIAEMLAGQFGAPVIDKTGLTGKYYFDLKTYDVKASERSDNETNPWPPLETAIQDQLGLKLVPSHGPVPFLVVDHAEMPSEN